ncbi:Copia type Polyprotein [Phytophthora megakarya]|uniref:Copia type Polyprotein n=1 Tax=Phytophthora megakarya TaxID=4795 RepID=A0A225UG49_9STRA|nr:Copia type Polyprotein [Phytophthora megakarya]
MDVKVSPVKPKEPYGPEVNRKDLPYRQILGSLQYLVRCTRPDITNAECILSKFIRCYTSNHYTLAQQVLAYLKGTATYGLVLRKKYEHDDLSIDADADLGNDLDNRRSITGQVVTFGGCVIAYQSKHQAAIITDTCSAELTAASSCADRIRWLQNLLMELQIPIDFPARLWTDSTSAVQVITRTSGHYKIKCLDFGDL